MSGLARGHYGGRSGRPLSGHITIILNGKAGVFTQIEFEVLELVTWSTRVCERQRRSVKPLGSLIIDWLRVQLETQRTTVAQPGVISGTAVVTVCGGRGRVPHKTRVTTTHGSVIKAVNIKWRRTIDVVSAIASHTEISRIRKLSSHGLAVFESVGDWPD